MLSLCMTVIYHSTEYRNLFTVEKSCHMCIRPFLSKPNPKKKASYAKCKYATPICGAQFSKSLYSSEVLCWIRNNNIVAVSGLPNSNVY